MKTNELTTQVQSLGNSSSMASKDVNESIQAIENMAGRMEEIDYEVTVIESLKLANNL